MTLDEARPLLAYAQRAYRLNSDELWLYQEQMRPGSCLDGSLAVFPEKKEAPIVPMPVYPDAEDHAAEFRAHLLRMQRLRGVGEAEATWQAESMAAAAGVERSVAPQGLDGRSAAEQARDEAEAQREAKVSYGTLQRQLLGVIEDMLVNGPPTPELSALTAEREARIAKLKAAAPSRGGAPARQKWRAPDLSKAPRWVIPKKRTPAPPPVVVPPETDDVVQVVLGAGDSSFIQSMEYHPKERKLRITTESGSKFWFHDVQDDFMAAFGAKLEADEGRGLPKVFTTGADFDAHFATGRDFREPPPRRLTASSFNEPATLGCKREEPRFNDVV